MEATIFGNRTALHTASAFLLKIRHFYRHEIQSSVDKKQQQKLGQNLNWIEVTEKFLLIWKISI